jgi:transcriptional regulator with XRE-family HTH domain
MLNDGKQLVEFLEELIPEEEKILFELDDLLLNFSMMVLNYRVAHGLTQKQLAEKIGVSQAMIAKYECGEFNPSLKTIWEVSRKMGFGVHLNFFDREGRVPESEASGGMLEEESKSMETIQFEQVSG